MATNTNTFSTKIENYSFSKNGVLDLKKNCEHGEDWPVVYKTSENIDTHSKSSNNRETIENIINAYIVLLTQGVYGTYVYAVDKNLREYIKSLIK